MLTSANVLSSYLFKSIQKGCNRRTEDEELQNLCSIKTDSTAKSRMDGPGTCTEGEIRNTVYTNCSAQIEAQRPFGPDTCGTIIS